MELLGVALAILGIVFAFETPRNAFLRSIGLSGSNSIHRFFYRAPKQEITTSSVILYIRTSPTSLGLDQSIAMDQRAQLKHFQGDGQWLVEKIKALGIADIRQLDRIVRQHSYSARLLAHAFEQERTATQGDGLSHALEIEAMNRFDSTWYDNYLAKLTLTSTGPGYATTVLEFYKTITDASA